MKTTRFAQESAAQAQAEAQEKLKHTPGPWFHRSVEGGWDGVRDSSGQVICNLVLNVPENATLIAAAPEMLEALQWILAHPFANLQMESGDKARQAIAKATGK